MVAADQQIDPVERCPHCRGGVLYEQIVYYVRQGSTRPAVEGPEKGRLKIWECGAWPMATRPTGRTTVWCTNVCPGSDDGYLGVVAPKHWLLNP